MQNNWETMTALELGHKIATNFIDPVELAEYFLERIKDHDGARSIYVRHTKARALEEAEAARVRVRAGMTRSRLDGVPISVSPEYEDCKNISKLKSLPLIEVINLIKHEASALIQ